jgi:hypothetical protein
MDEMEQTLQLLVGKSDNLRPFDLQQFLLNTARGDLGWLTAEDNVKTLQQQLFDVHYAELLRDPMSMVQRIYEFFDLELTGAAETAMERFLVANPKNKGGVHRYSLEEFGLTPETERRRFQFYLDFFGIEPEK